MTSKFNISLESSSYFSERQRNKTLGRVHKRLGEIRIRLNQAVICQSPLSQGTFYRKLTLIINNAELFSGALFKIVKIKINIYSLKCSLSDDIRKLIFYLFLVKFVYTNIFFQ